MGLMVALLPYQVDADDIGFTGGLPVDELHVTSRYYGTDTTPDVVPALRQAATGIGARFATFVANIDGYGPLGSDTPQALVLHLDAPEFHEIRDMLPEPDPDGTFTVYPTYLPHLTLGYGIPDHAAENVDGTVGIKFDRIAVCDGDDWFVVPLTGTRAETATTSPFEVLQHSQSEPRLASGDSAHTAAIAGRRKDRQRCYGGTPQSCKSVRWIRVYEALRNKGMSKRRAAMISNSMYKHWVTGVPRRRDKRPIVRRAFP